MEGYNPDKKNPREVPEEGVEPGVFHGSHEEYPHEIQRTPEQDEDLRNTVREIVEKNKIEGK